MSDAAHVEAVEALLSGAVRLYVNRVPDDPDLPYAVLYMATPDRVRDRLAAVTVRQSNPFQVTSVALDEGGLRSVTGRVATALLDIRPSVTGYSTDPIRSDGGSFPQVDRDVTPHRLFVAEQFTFSSVPA